MSLMDCIDHPRRGPLRRTLGAVVLGAWLALGSALALAAAPGQFQIRDAWIRWLPSGLPAAGYVTLVNQSDRPLTLVSASGAAYGQISLHHSMNQEGMSHMEPLSQISVPAHSSLAFAASGYHLMLMQPTHPLAPGDHVALTLHFADGAERSVSFEVRAPNGSAPAHSDMSGMPMGSQPQTAPR